MAIQIQYLDKGLHEVHLLQKVQWMVCDDLRLGVSSIDETAKATLVRAQLPQAIGLGAGPLIPEPGRQGYFFNGYHDQTNVEFIVPNKLSAFVVLMKKVTYEYRNWEKHSKTVHIP